ncbi:hypothetical protein RRG08_063265 [Elysia crispata]|uniref:Uncharacterized protein n=1 Tax=Elysia crispata TaxID=231223 RepID=A0AAE0XQ98_9GAST|nr:hypothetical protein RRG08_063265 [Elysia crispata]
MSAKIRELQPRTLSQLNTVGGVRWYRFGTQSRKTADHHLISSLDLELMCQDSSVNVRIVYAEESTTVSFGAYNSHECQTVTIFPVVWYKVNANEEQLNIHWSRLCDNHNHGCQLLQSRGLVDLGSRQSICGHELRDRNDLTSMEINIM